MRSKRKHSQAPLSTPVQYILMKPDWSIYSVPVSHPISMKQRRTEHKANNYAGFCSDT